MADTVEVDRLGVEGESVGRTLAAEIVTTGTEILLGEIVDTNAAWIAQQLREAGVNLYFKTTVGDNEARIRGVIELALSRSNVVIVSGGLGPTVDDVTRHAIAAATGRTLLLQPEALETLKARFARFGVAMTPNNVQQAMIPEGAILIENPVGTAPGFIVETGDSAVIALPGVPREMKHLMAETVLPYLRTQAGNRGIIRRRVLRTIGIGESTIDDRLHDFMNGANPTVGLAAHTAQCDVRITARAEDAQTAEQMIDTLERSIRERIGEYVYSTTPEEPFEAVVARALENHGATVAILESNTRGRLATRLTAVGVTLAAQGVIGQETDDAHGIPVAVSLAISEAGEGDAEAQVCSTANALRDASGATFALVLMGSTGEDEGVYGATSGQTWIGFAGPDQTLGQLLPFGGRDDYTLVRIGNQALGMLWRVLK